MITTAVGNFPKVAESKYGTVLIKSINSWQKKELSDSQLEGVFRDLTRAVIKEQEEAGLDVLTDGQLRWEDLVTPFARGLEGFEINGLERFFDNNVYYRKPILNKTPVRKGKIFVEDFLFAKSATNKPVKAILPGPYTVVKLSEDRFYKNEKKMLFKIAQILNEEAIDLAKAGAEIIQLDEPALNFGKPPIKDCIEAIRIVFAGINKKKALYTYFGKFEKGLFSALQRSCVDIIGVDIVSDPKAITLIKEQKWIKGLAVGCLDARNTKPETKAQLHKVFDVVTKLVPCDRLYVNPSCGLEFLPYEQARQKLDCLVESVKSYIPKSQVLCCARKAGN